VGYVSNSASNNITVFDKIADQAVAVIATGSRPAGMAVDQIRRIAYVALSGDDAIEMVDIALGDILNRIRLNQGDRPQELALTPDGKLLITVNPGSNTVSFVDPLSLLQVRRLSVGNGPNSVLLDSTGRRAYVFNTVSSSISVIDIASKSLITTIPTDAGPLRGQFNRAGNRFYVIHEWSSYLSVIDTASLAVIKRGLVRMGMESIKVDTNTDLIYLGRKRDVTVEIYEPFTLVSIDFIRTGGEVTYMTIDGEENNLYLLNSARKKVMVSNLVSRKISREIDVGQEPYWISMMGER
jgi:YVTN family beta-propeller protein